MKIFGNSLVFGIGMLALVSVSCSNTSISTSDSDSITSSATMYTTTIPSIIPSETILPPSESIVASLPTQLFSINTERPKMINQINNQRSGMSQSLLCQDSLLTSLAQQHANDMAAIDDLNHDLSCSSDAYPVQFCNSSDRLSPYGQAAENILSLTGSDGSSSAAMAVFNSDATKFSNMMNPDYLYIGVGMAMNAVSGKYYWVQVFSAGNYQGVSCTLTPSVTVLDAFNRTSTTVQPLEGLNQGLYPKGINNGNSINRDKKLYCTMIPFAHGKGSSALPLGQLPYPTITMVPSSNSTNEKVSGIIGAFQNALAQANATIVGPSSIALLPMMQVTTSDNSASSASASITTSSTPINPESFLSSFSPTNSAQSSAFAAVSSMMADPTMSSAAAQMAQFMALANNYSSTSTTI